MVSEFCSGELCSRYHVYKNLWDASVGEELPLYETPPTARHDKILAEFNLVVRS